MHLLNISAWYNLNMIKSQRIPKNLWKEFLNAGRLWDVNFFVSTLERFFLHHSGILCNFELNFSWPWNEFHYKFVANVLSVFSAGSSNALERSRDVSNCHCNFTALKWWKHKHLLATSGFLRRNPSLWPILRTTPSWLRYRDSLFYQMFKHLFFFGGNFVFKSLKRFSSGI